MNIKQKLESTKNHFKRNKNAYRVAAVTVPVILLQHNGIKSLNQFLKDNDLFEKYYSPEEDEN